MVDHGDVSLPYGGAKEPLPTLSPREHFTVPWRPRSKAEIVDVYCDAADSIVPRQGAFASTSVGGSLRRPMKWVLRPILA